MKGLGKVRSQIHKHLIHVIPHHSCLLSYRASSSPLACFLYRVRLILEVSFSNSWSTDLSIQHFERFVETFQLSVSDFCNMTKEFSMDCLKKAQTKPIFVLFCFLSVRRKTVFVKHFMAIKKKPQESHFFFA